MYCKLGKGTAALMCWDSLWFYSVWQTLLFEFRFYLCELNALSIYGPCLQGKQQSQGGVVVFTEAPAGQHRLWVKARQRRGGSSHHSASHCYPSPQNTDLYLATPVKIVFLSDPKKDLSDQVTILHNYIAMENEDFWFIWPSGPDSPDCPLHCA